jgi:hypothetical protein
MKGNLKRLRRQQRQTRNGNQCTIESYISEVNFHTNTTSIATADTTLHVALFDDN